MGAFGRSLRFARDEKRKGLLFSDAVPGTWMNDHAFISHFWGLETALACLNLAIPRVSCIYACMYGLCPYVMHIRTT